MIRVFTLLTFLVSSIFADINSSLNSSNRIKVDNNVTISVWEAKKGDKIVYLIGTMHLKDKRANSAFSKVKGLIERSDEVYTEIPLTDKSVLKSLKYIIRDDNKSLKEILPKEVYRDLELYLKDIDPKLTPKRFDMFKIWAISSSLSILKNAIKNRDVKSIDKQIFSYALTLNKKVGGVETIEEQVAIFDELSLKEQIENLKISLKEQSDGVDKIKDYYFRGDNKKIIEIFKRLNKKYPQPVLLDKILYQRNIKMAKRIDNIISKHSSQRYIFAFGIMHFLGDKSVVELLKAKGYNITLKKLK
jgi:uncharacterized protein YbaP (TraB family)